MNSDSTKPNHLRTLLWYAGSVLLAGIALAGLFYRMAYVWIFCPQALAVMFYRQSLRPYDSLGAADYPDLAVALLYFPLVGWFLDRAHRAGRLPQSVLRTVIGHLVAVALAILALNFRNQIWAYQLGS